jgi:hypothetical protein
MEKTEFILQSNGAIIQRTINERELKVEASTLEVLTENVTRQTKNVFHLPEWGTVHASVGLSDTVWSVPIRRIPIHARFRLVEGVMVPVFTSTKDIELPLVWNVPSAVTVVFVVLTQDDGESASIIHNYLFALDADKRGYRLPLPNLFDDCRICTGEFALDHANAFECVCASLEQFNQSQWNADLMQDTQKSQHMFRFQPSDENFETLPMLTADWTGLCRKVSTALLERIIV